jgi:hypothetical protein
MRTSKRAVHRLIAEAVESLEAARRIVEAPAEAILSIGDFGGCQSLFAQAVEFDWSRLDSSIRHLPNFSEKSCMLRPTEATPHQVEDEGGWTTWIFDLDPVPFKRRPCSFTYPFIESALHAPVVEIDLLDDEGRPAKDAIEKVRAWAGCIVALGERVLGDDEVDDGERRFPEPTTALSPKAHAVRQQLLNAWPKGLKGPELVHLLDEKHDLAMEASHLSQMIVRELKRAGCPVRNVRGVGYQLVPAGGAE